ncbi:DUF418 domain-containing protein [Paenibacillus sp. GCM10027627]|uniref:DUF418 domain-containing protein n=1 Tax=unclassified Paenibacillus TaxID=185978 RepID=UPI00363C56AC
MERSVNRIRMLDILRGFAILGTLGTNIWIFAYIGDSSQVVAFEVNKWWESMDKFLQTLVLTFVNGKFLGLLSVMFGVGLEMKYQQSLRKGSPWPGTYLWVSIILMLEGFIHFTLVMEYDILMGYALAAIIVAFIVRAGDKAIRRTIKWVGGIHLLLVSLLFAGIFLLANTGGDASYDSGVDFGAIYSSGTWFEQVQARLSNFLVLRFEVFFALPLNIVLFLCGVLLMRNGAFGDDEKGRGIRRKLMKWGIGLGLPLTLLSFVPLAGLDVFVRYLFAPLLAMGYLAVIARILEWKPHFRLWNWLEQTGKMSLSCYVLQNILSTVIFYGWGLGLGGKLDSIQIIGVWIAVSMVQLLFANVWLGIFKLGPMEGMRKRAVSLFS